MENTFKKKTYFRKKHLLHHLANDQNCDVLTAEEHEFQQAKRKFLGNGYLIGHREAPSFLDSLNPTMNSKHNPSIIRTSSMEKGLRTNYVNICVKIYSNIFAFSLGKTFTFSPSFEDLDTKDLASNFSENKATVITRNTSEGETFLSEMEKGEIPSKICSVLYPLYRSKQMKLPRVALYVEDYTAEKEATL